jgi:hypothetical protein
MSSNPSIDMNLTSVEKKVIKNTLFTNSNCLQTKERSHSHLSLFSRKSQNCSTIYKEDISHISKSSFFPSFINPPTPAPFPLQQKLNDSPSYSTITLPGDSLKLSSLSITKSIHLKGIQGTKLLLENEGITISGENLEVTFSELTISVISGIGITLDSKISLEVSDCVISGSDQSKFISVVNDSKLTLNSCDITGFEEVIRTHFKCEVTVCKCHFSCCNGSALVLVDPSSVVISTCFIEKCKKSAVEISFLSDFKNNDLLIDQNDIVHNQGAGLSIFSDTFHHLGGKIVITRNKISNNKKEGLSIRHLAIFSFTCENNDFAYNGMTSCWIQKVQRIENEGNFEISSNRFSDSLMGYGLYIYSSSVILSKNEIFRNSLGGVFITGKCSKGPDFTKIFTFSSNSIDLNGGNGIEISGYSNRVLIENCKISENSRSGLCCMNNLKEDALEVIETRNCEINFNSEYGVVVVKSRCLFWKVNIQENAMGEVLFGEDSSHYVRFDDRTSFSGLTQIKSQKSCRGSCLIY